MAGPAEDMDYLIVKTVHQSAVALSFAGFFARGLGALADAPWVGARAAKTLPHIVDSVLLLSALWLAWALRLNPVEAPWLLAKIIGLLAYIGLGMVALNDALMDLVTKKLVAPEEALSKAVDRVNADVSVIEKVRRFILADEPFSVENEMLTPSMKIRRHVIGSNYGERLDALYKK